MEKQPNGSVEPQQLAIPGRAERKQRALSQFVLAMIVGCLVYYSFSGHGTWFPLRHASSGTPSDTGDAFSWESTPSKPYLDYRQCYDSFQCARLELPMDYWNGTTDATVSIAIIKKPAAIPVTHPQYGGAVLHNPGGPGGSGVSFLLRAGEGLREIVGSPDGLQFDHISFDPRGILYSTPRVECFDDPLYELFWTGRIAEEGVYSSSDAAFGRLWSMAAAQSGVCALPPEDDGPDIKKYVNTAFVARDMLEIVERHGEWREAEAKRLLGASKSKACEAAAVLEKLKHRSGEEKINYWGFSYGTYLGNTFAAMFPDRINRLIVDGVVDAYDYRKTLWLDNLVDTEQDLKLLYYHCARVGWPKCAMANQTGDTTIEGVKARIDNITASLYHNPMPIVSRQGPAIITYSDVKAFLFMALYVPIEIFPLVTDWLHTIEQGTVTTSWDLSAGFASGLSQDATTAIACSDGESQKHVSKEEFRQHVDNLNELSPSLGEIWAGIRLKCIHYDDRSYYRFTNDWVGNTSHPIMEIGNTADPVTPGRYAKKMAKGFTGAVALIQDSPGHCSSAAPSNCTTTYVRRYFQTGELPEEGTVCPVDEMPFGKAEGDEEEMLSLEAKRMREHHKAISGAILAANRGVGRSGLLTALQQARGE